MSTRLTAARSEYNATRENLMEEHRQELKTYLAPLQDEVEGAVVEMYAQGASISAICREYGTTARATITDILRKHGVYKKGTYRGYIA